MADGTPDPTNGVTEFVVGTGGRSHTGFLATTAPNSVGRDDTTYGVLELRLYRGGWTAQFLPIAGQTFTDSESGSCR